MIGRFGIVLLLVASAVVMACGDDEKDQRNNSAQPVNQEPQAQLGRASPEEQNLGTRAIEVFDDRVDPRQLRISAANPVQLEIANRSSAPCQFFIGQYVSGVLIGAGETAKQSLTLPQTNIRTNNTQTMRMGCDGDTKRQGDAVIEFRGTTPGNQP